MKPTVIEFPRAQASRRGVLRAGSGATLALIASRAALAATERPSGTVTISQIQVSLLLSAGWGDGILNYQGQQHPFRLRGLGAVGVGVSTIEASGFVYNLTKLSDFPGLYGQLEAGAVAGHKNLPGGLWLQNPAGVRLNLRTRRQGLSLNAGGSGILLEFKT